jgi:deoxycytidylate deaminase
VAEAIVKIHTGRATAKADSSDRLIGKFRGRGSKELVIGFAGPSGCDIPAIVLHAKQQLLDMGYEDVVHIKLSKFIQEGIDTGLITPQLDHADESGSAAYNRYRSLQEGGKELRRQTGNRAILAEYAAKEIRFDREKRAKTQTGSVGAATTAPDSDRPVEPGKVAYLVDQLKRPEEVALLRAIYRGLFYVVGVTRVADRRRAALRAEHIPEDKIARLMELDRRESDDDGQRLEQTLHTADYFIRNDATVDRLKREKVKRLLDLIHGDTSVSPTDHEQGMYVAYAAGLRSACLSRQVGAALADPRGEIISTGCNDVPRAGGGLYGASKEGVDYRCVHHEAQYCFNDHYKRDLKEFEDVIAGWPQEVRVKLTAEDVTKLLDGVYKHTRLGSLIEFSRSVHAEMDSIIAAARAGAKGVVGGTLYTTTFPCHSCARHIVAAGIATVYYIEPYEKSMAKDLHGDSIAFEVEEPPSRAHGDKPAEHVAFLHFEGVAPRQYQNFFKAGQRKVEGVGTVLRFDKRQAEKAVPEYLDNYQDFETKAIQNLNNELEALKAD